MVGAARPEDDVMQGGLQSQAPAASSAGGRWEFGLATLAVIAFTAPGMLLLGLSDDPAAPPNPLLRLYWPPVYLLVLGLCIRRRREMMRAWAPGLLVALPVAWAWASQSWSIMPDDTGRRAFALALTTLFGFYLGAAFSGRRMVQIIAAAGLVLGLGSIAIAVAIPRYGVEQLVNVGCWRGLWDTKNALAAFMTVGALASACAASLPGAYRRLWLGGLAVCGFDLLMSRGKTSLVCLLLGLGLFMVLAVARRGPARAVLTVWATGLALMVAGFTAVVTPGVFFKAIGKDPTLTGRTEIWTAVLGQVAQRPLTGFGFAAFWGKTSIPAQVVAKQTGWAAPEAHNGWLDLLAQVGWVGAVLAGTACVIALIYAVARPGRDDGHFASIYIVIFLAMSLAESVLLSGNDLIWVVFLAALTQVMRPVARSSPSAGPSVQLAAAPAGVMAAPWSGPWPGGEAA